MGVGGVSMLDGGDAEGAGDALFGEVRFDDQARLIALLGNPVMVQILSFSYGRFYHPSKH